MQLTALHIVLLAVYLFVLLVVCVYGFHRYALVYLYYKHSDNTPKPRSRFAEPPTVTVQLPMFNERFVARRVIEHACRIDYPQNKLQIQVLDDSTDDTTEIARQTVEEMRAAGHDVILVHRDDRTGYKAGALEQGLATATGEFVCVFDADFVPVPNILQDTIHYFTDPQVGMVQARWEHLNRSQSLLTKVQAVLLDGHFVLEHGGRNRSGRFMSFNGTAGIWRRTCIEDAGGWQHDTLTEDLDLSYRAQMKGWRFLFLPAVDVPAELPPEIGAFKAQQHRWAKGGAQTCKKLLPAILRSPWPWQIKLEAFFQLTANVVCAFVVLLSLLLFPVLSLKLHSFQDNLVVRILFDVSLLTLATFSAGTFYFCSQRELDKSRWESLKYLPALMSLGIGLAINNAWAMLQGFFGKPSEFVRTPKYGIEGDRSSQASPAKGYVARRDFKWQPWIELGMGVYMTACLIMCLLRDRLTLGIPFIMLFASGYLYVALMTLAGPWWRRRSGRLRVATSKVNPGGG